MSAVIVFQKQSAKMFITSNISFSHNVFYPSGELSAIFIEFEIVVCWKSLKLFVWERLMK